MANERDRVKAPERQDGPADQETIDFLDRQKNNPKAAADYQAGPETATTDPSRASADRTGTAERADRAAGPPADSSNRNDADRAFRDSRGDRRERNQF